MTGLDAAAQSVAEVTAQRGATEVVTMNLAHEGIATVVLSGKGRIALVELCAITKTVQPAKPRELDELDPTHATPVPVDSTGKPTTMP